MDSLKCFSVGRIARLLLLVFASFLLLSSFAPATSAADGQNYTCSKPTFFGLVPWYQYLDYKPVVDNQKNTHCEVQNFTVLGKTSGVLLILLAVIDDLLRVAGIVAVVFVIIGGFKFITSNGEPEQAASARKSIIFALVGLAIALIAVVLVSFIGNSLGAG